MFKRKHRKEHYRDYKTKKEKEISLEDDLIAEEKRVKSKLYRTLIIFFSVVLLLALLFLAGWFLFDVEQIEVEGNELYKDELIAEQVLNDEYSWNALYVYLKYKFKEPETIPFIDKMKVRLADRNTIVISVYEKELVGYAYVSSTGQYAYIDKDGIVVERSTNIIPGVAYIEGLDVTEVRLYEKLQVKDESLFKELLNLTQALEKHNLMPETIIVCDMGNLQLSYGDILVNFGQAEKLNDKVLCLQGMMKKAEGMKGILHMENWKNKDSSCPFELTETEEKNE